MSTIQLLTVCGVPSIIAFLFQIIFNAWNNRKKKKDQETKIERRALQALLRDRIQEQHRFFTTQGYCSMADKSNIENIYKCYHELGQNGVMTSAFEEIMSLPIQEEKK